MLHSVKPCSIHLRGGLRPPATLGQHFDFVYVDARHDYKGVYEDMVAYWPKLKKGGIMAGHDYVTQFEGPQQGGQRWQVNYDGTEDKTNTVVKGAVDRFSTERCRQLTIAYGEPFAKSGKRDKWLWPTWALRK